MHKYSEQYEKSCGVTFSSIFIFLLLLFSCRNMNDSFPVFSYMYLMSFSAGVDLITACDIRLCSQDAWFQVKV